jgi:hypothetical protein
MSTPSGELAMVGLYLLVRTLLPVSLAGWLRCSAHA